MAINTEVKVGAITYNGTPLELAGGSDTPSTEWQPHPDWWDIKTILDNDTRDYPYKIIYLLDDTTDTISFTQGDAYATSDGAFYETSSVTHTWDKTKDKPCYVSDIEMYKTRYYIFYSNKSIVKSSSIEKKDVLYVYFDKDATKNEEDIKTFFLNAGKLEGVPEFNTSNVLNFQSLFTYCYSLKSVPPFDTNKAKYVTSIFSGCYYLQNSPTININTSNSTDLSNLFNDCKSLTKVSGLDTSNVTNFNSLFSNCTALTKVSDLDTSNATNLNNLFNGCKSITELPHLNTSKATNFQSLVNGCELLQKILILDLISATNINYMFSNCSNLQYVGLKNIKITGISLSYAKKLYRNCIIDIIKQLWDYSGGETSYKITFGSSNTPKIANVYVKLITPTAEQIAEDPYIESKMPCEVCESTDEGAMLIMDYASAKGWTIS